MPKKDRLWTPRFIILWQSQLISTMGDAVYGIALGFWVLSKTGSTALMGALMAASTLPGVVAAPFAGALIDRTHKKHLLVLLDMIRAAAVVLLAMAAYTGLIQLWMVFITGVFLSLCGAIFSPCLQSSIPFIAPAAKIPQANSAFSAVYTSSKLLGYTAGGFLYQIMGAPLLFLINGLTFLFSGLSLPFVKIPENASLERQRLLADIADGFRFILGKAGLKTAVIVLVVSSFFSSAAFTLFIPLCKYTPGLGSGRYGILMACFTGGGLIGYALLSAISIRLSKRMAVLITASIAHDVLLAAFVIQPYFIVMAVMLLIAGIMNAVFNVVLVSTIQLSTPRHILSKVMSFVAMLVSGLTPFAMALGGAAGEALPVRAVITAAFLLSLAVTVPLCFSRRFRKFISADYERSHEN